MKKGVTLVLVILAVAIIALILIFMQPKQGLQAGQQVSLVLKERIGNFTCSPDIGNFGGRFEYYEIWNDSKKIPYILHTETHILTKHPPEDMEGNTTITKYFDTSLSNDVSGIVKEEDMQYCDARYFGNYNFCNATFHTDLSKSNMWNNYTTFTCLVIEKQ